MTTASIPAKSMQVEESQTAMSSNNPKLDPSHESRCTEYEETLRDTEVRKLAAQKSANESMILCTALMVVYVTLSTMYFYCYVKWSVRDSLFFINYTFTTVGFGGSHDIPEDNGTMIFIIANVFIGISLWAVFLNQSYKSACLLWDSRIPDDRDKSYLARRGLEMMEDNGEIKDFSMHGLFQRFAASKKKTWYRHLWSAGRKKVLKVRKVTRSSKVGALIQFLVVSCGCVGILAGVVGIIEGWGVIQSIYFSVM